MLPEMSNHLPVLLAAATPPSGSTSHDPGVLLKWVLVVAVLGSVFLAWFLLRGYRNED